MMTPTLLRLGAAATVSALLWSCSESKKTPVEPGPGDEDVVTRVVLAVSPDGGTTEQRFVWEDADGPSGNAPNQIDTVRLAPGITYTATLSLYNTTVSPVVDVTSEIAEYANEHQFFFAVNGGVFTMTATDTDGRSLPVGLASRIANVVTGTGTLTVNLSHYDDPTTKDGVTPSDETDVSVTWPVIIP